MTTTRNEEKIGRNLAGEYRKGRFHSRRCQGRRHVGRYSHRRPAPRQRWPAGWAPDADEFVAEIEALIAQDLVDIMLTSASNMELLQTRGAFGSKPHQAGIPGNDTTDVWNVMRGCRYREAPSRPFPLG